MARNSNAVEGFGFTTRGVECHCEELLQEGISLLLLLMALVVSPAAIAQSSTGLVNGPAKDSTGGVVPGTTINLLNVETKVVRHTLTNSNGYFEIQNVEPGTYTLEVTTTGFKKNAIPPFPVDVNQTVTQNQVLALGETS